MNFFEKLTGKTGGELMTDAVSAAKARVSSSVAKTLSNDPNVQQDIKEGIGQRIGVWLLDNWMLVTGGIILAVVGFLFFRRKR